MWTEKNPKPNFINENLTSFEKEDLLALIREYIDVFTWNYEYMSGLDPKVIVHRLNIMLAAKPVKQQQWCFQPKLMEAIEVK